MIFHKEESEGLIFTLLHSKILNRNTVLSKACQSFLKSFLHDFAVNNVKTVGTSNIQVNKIKLNF